jgi:hypothetical protein
VKFKVNLISFGSEKDSFDLACFDKKILEDYQDRANLAFMKSKKFEEKSPTPAYTFSQKYNKKHTIEFEAKLPKNLTVCKIFYAAKFFGSTTYLPKEVSFSQDKKRTNGFIPNEKGFIEFTYNGHNGDIFASKKFENIELVFNDK